MRWLQDLMLNFQKIQTFLLVFWGVPYSCRASGRLFTSKILVANASQYTSISQKVLKGAAARVFIYWLCAAVGALSSGSQHDLKLDHRFNVLWTFSQIRCSAKIFTNPIFGEWIVLLNFLNHAVDLQAKTQCVHRPGCLLQCLRREPDSSHVIHQT